MIYFYLTILTLIAGLIAVLLIKDRLLDKAVRNVPPAILEEIIFELGKVESTNSRSFFLQANQPNIRNDFRIKLPDKMNIDWLDGKHIRTILNPDPETEDDLGEVYIETSEPTSDFRLIPIPCVVLKNGKVANRYQPKHWFKKNNALHRIAVELYPRDPERFLYSLLHRCGKVNSPFDWVQTPPRTKCKNCGKKLLPVFQITGGAIGLGGDMEVFVAACNCTEGKFYLFTQFN